MRNFLQDVRYATRWFRKSPAFTAVAVLTLALGIGANTAIFTVVNAVLLRPLPYKNPERVVVITEKSQLFDTMSVSFPNFMDWKAQSKSFSQLAAVHPQDFNMKDVSGAKRVRGRNVSAEFFLALGVRPQMGRDFNAQDDHPGAAPVAIISHEFWARQFATDPGIVGRNIILTDRNYTIVGVLPPAFWFDGQYDVFTPARLSTELWATNRTLRSGTRVVARLREGVTHQQADGEMKAIAARLAQQYPDANTNISVNVFMALDYFVGSVKSKLVLLLGAVGFVLLIACVNVANLLLARATSRSREMAIREAMGATRGRLVKQLLTESVILSLAGGLAGVAIAPWCASVLVAAAPESLPRTEVLNLDGRVFLFTLGLSLFTGILFGLIPAFKSSFSELHDGLKEGIRGSTGKRHFLSDALVVVELGLALVLLACAGLTLRSIALLNRVDPGFNSKNALTFYVALSREQYATPDKIRKYFRDVMDKLETVPGVQAASVATNVPLRDDSEIFFYVGGRAVPERKDLPWASFYVVSPDYQAAMGLHLLSGRFFVRQDSDKGTSVVVVDDALARNLFPNQNPVGQHIIIPFAGLDQPREIVGVVNHVKHFGLAGDAESKIQSQFYMPFAQVPDALMGEVAGSDMSIIVRTTGEPAALASSVQAAVRSLDKDLPVYSFQTLSELVQTSMATQKFATILLGGFALLALVLASIGIYGVMSYSVGLRTQELGIRLALGATRSEVLRLILNHGTRLALIGTGIGLATALMLTRLLSSLLFGIRATDPLTFGLVSLLLVGIALLASYIPARRATRVDPIVALRYE
jgi:putative ABC transport system permease protein